VGSICIALSFAGEWQAEGALLVAILCLLPALWFAQRMAYLSLKIFSAVTLITQIMTVPMFYLRQEKYAFGGYRPYGFSALDVVPVLLPLGIYLLIVAYMVKLIQRIVGDPGFWKGHAHHLVGTENPFQIIVSRAKNQTLLLLGILLLMAISFPVKLWMFDMGIGIIGTQSPQLPYHLSGILYYLFGFVTPMIIGYLYIKSKRKSILLASLISIYALMIGLSSSSKAVLLITIAPVIAFAWIDRQRIILIVSGLMVGFGVLVTSESRKIVHVINGISTSSFTDLGSFGTLFETLSRLELTVEIFWVFSNIAARFQNFQNLLLSARFNSEAIGGPWKLFLKSINHNWVDLSHDSIHIEYLGYTIPVGFYNVAATMNDWMMMAINKNIFMMVPFALYVAITLVLVEKSIWRVCFKYRLPLPIAQAILFTTTLGFYVGPGALEIRTLLLIIVLLGILPTFALPRISRPT